MQRHRAYVRGFLIVAVVGVGFSGEDTAASGAPAVAKVAGTTAALATTPCADAATQLEATRCWGASAQLAEASLARELAKSETLVRQKAGESAAVLFRDTQAHWGHYRDAECALQRKRYEGGSAEAMSDFVCRWRMATDRATEVRTDRNSWAAE
jgi:uncharacterized protein YecT (DUF1311 family)